MFSFGEHIRKLTIESPAFSKSDSARPLPFRFFKGGGGTLNMFFLTIYVPINLNITNQVIYIQLMLFSDISALISLLKVSNFFLNFALPVFSL